MPNIPLVPMQELEPSIRAMLAEAAAKGTPNPVTLQVLAHHPEILQPYYRLWVESFHRGVLSHRLKEIVRVRIAGLVGCAT